MRRREALYRRLLGVADVVSALLAVVLGVALIGEDRLAASAVLALPLVVLVSKVSGLYDRDEHLLRKTTLDEAPALFQMATLYTLLIWISDGLLVEGELGKDQVVGLWGLLFVGMMLGRALTRQLTRVAATPERCLLLGNRPAVERINAKLASDDTVNATVVGWLPIEGGTGASDHDGSLAADELGGMSLGPSLAIDESDGFGGLGRRFRRHPASNGRHDRFRAQPVARIVRRHAVERVIIAPSSSESDELLEIIQLVKALGVRVSVLPRLFEVVGSSSEFDEVGGMTLLGLRRYGLGKSSRALKRTMDLVGASAGILILSPLMLLAAAAVRVDSAGPVFFRQRRVGRDEHPFEMLKFRTMVVDAEEMKAELEDLNESDGFFKIADDPRCTRVGRLLRRSCVDELPQLFNVLRGDMSLVGPRPLVPDDDSRVEGLQRRRLDVTPGMTGHWQILGSSRVPLEEMVKIDYLYGASWSLWGDVKILVRTFAYVLRLPGL